MRCVSVCACAYHRKALASCPNGIEANGMNFHKISSRSLNDNNNNNNTLDITIFSMLQEHSMKRTVQSLIYAYEMLPVAVLGTWLSSMCALNMMYLLYAATFIVHNWISRLTYGP